MRNLDGYFFVGWEMRQPYNKEPMTVGKQVDQLISNGILIVDKERARQFFSVVSYFRFCSYWYPFRKHDNQEHFSDQMVEGTTLESAIELYEFDRRLRLVVMDAVERLEVAVRSLVVNQVVHGYGTFGHTKSEHFHPNFSHGI